MATLNYIDENGNINKAGVIPKNYPASNVSYGEGTVADALDDLNRGSVSVTADGTKTFGQILDDLYSLIDITKLSHKSVLDYGYSLYLFVRNGSRKYFVNTYIANTSTYQVTELAIGNGNSRVYQYDGSTISDITSNVIESGQRFTIYY